MGRNAKRKQARREERRLLESHPERQCGNVNAKTTERCELAGRWEIITEEGQRTYDADTLETKIDAGGRIYACHIHVIGFRALGNTMRRIA